MSKEEDEALDKIKQILFDTIKNIVDNVSSNYSIFILVQGHKVGFHIGYGCPACAANRVTELILTGQIGGHIDKEDMEEEISKSKTVM